MRLVKSAVAAALVVAVAVPLNAAIKAMDLAELMEITSDAIHGEIIAKETLQDSRVMEGAVYTKLTVQGESLRTGETVTTEILFLGSHDPSDEFMISEMPTLQDTRVGGEGVFFIQPIAEFEDRNFVFDLSGAYRVEHGFGEPVVMGKGEGAAFAVNTKLVSVREQVRATHLAIEAAKAATPGLQK